MADFIAELWSFMRLRRKYWLIPVLVMLAVFGGLAVLAKGSVPKEVFLVSQRRDGSGNGELRKVLMTARPGNRFRHVFRRLSGAFEFHADGGDDHQGDRLVVVRTVHPPQVVAPRATIHPPAYTGVEPFVQSGGAIEALIGSEVELTVATTAPVRLATMVFLEGGRRLELVPSVLQDDSGTSTVQRGRFTIESSDRYQIELLADNGLRNPNPGTYPISALQDYAPVGRWLLPDDEGTPLLPEALLCVRFDVHDDFGLAAVDLAIEHASKRSLERSLLPASTKPATRGVITEWYPKAYVPTLPINDLSTVRGQATWVGVTVQPDALAPPFLREREPSHYYAARETDATPIAVVNEPSE